MGQRSAGQVDGFGRGTEGTVFRHTLVRVIVRVAVRQGETRNGQGSRKELQAGAGGGDGCIAVGFKSVQLSSPEPCTDFLFSQ